MTDDNQTTTMNNSHVEQDSTITQEEEEEELSEIFGGSMFEEPKDFRPPTPPPQTLTVVLTKELYFVVNLVGEHSLWAHCLWNSSKCISKWFAMGNTPILRWKNTIDYNDEEKMKSATLVEHPMLYEREPNIMLKECPSIKDKCVMELGAGGSLPSMTCMLLGSRRVLCTDYPEEELLDKTKQTWISNFGQEEYEEMESEARVEVRGHLWGKKEQLKRRSDCLYDEKGRFVRKMNEEELEQKQHNQTGLESETIVHDSSSEEQQSDDTDELERHAEKFDIIILSDLIFNTSTHWEMMTTVKSCSIPDHTEIYLTYSHHRPHKKRQELKAFEEAKYLGIEFELLFVQKYPAMFPDDPYPLEEREKVWMWRGKVKANK